MIYAIKTTFTDERGRLGSSLVPFDNEGAYQVYLRHLQGVPNAQVRTKVYNNMAEYLADNEITKPETW